MSKVSKVGAEECGKEKIKYSPVQEFYENQTIFITGGTGFIGKVLIEKLLRCCSGLSRIYVLIRKKKDKDPKERLRNLLKDTIFDKLRFCMPNFEDKITALAGDCSLENLGLSADDIALLKRDVSIIFHSAATVRFDEKLKVAIAINLRSTITILDLCKDVENLKAFIYVSTAYAHCYNNKTIEEKFYEYPVSYKDLLLIDNSLSGETTEAITPPLIKSWMNTYTCTKASAENFLRTESQNLPVAIFRPFIVTASVDEPIPGYIDNYNGVTGIIAGVVSGVMRTMNCDSKKVLNLVPVDFTISALIASAWDTALQTTRRGEDMLIYNYNSASGAPITFSMIRELGLKYNKVYPLKMALWYPSLRMTKYKFMYNFYKIFLHSIPAFLIDLLRQSIGKKPRMMKIYEKVHKMVDLMNYVALNEWIIKNDNVQSLWNKLDSRDQKVFRFTMEGFDWDKYFSTYMKGVRIFLFKDDLKTLDASRIKNKRLFLMNQLLFVAVICSTYYTLRKVFQRRSYKPPY